MFWPSTPRRTHRKPWITLLTAALIGLTPNTYAGVYKCLDSNGGTIFQDRPCSGDLMPANEALTPPATATAATSNPEPAASLPSDSSGNGNYFFWHATSNSSTVYLLGSVHFGREDMYPLPQAVMTAFASAPTLVVEADVSALDPSQALTLLTGKATYTDGGNLQSQLDPQTWQRLTDVSTELGLPAPLLNMQKPWMASMTLTALAVKRMGYSETLGIDMHFLNRARGNKTIVELEGLAWQTELMASLSSSEQILMLNDAIRMVEQGDDYFGRMIATWQRGDTAGLEALMRESFGDTSATAGLTRKILTDRNATMAAKIRDLAQNGTPLFVVVGAAHMIGENGLVAHLQRQGYAIQQF